MFMNYITLFLVCSCLSFSSYEPFVSDFLTLPSSITLETIEAKIQPTITYGTMRYDCNGFKKDDVVEILEDVCHGGKYRVKKDQLITWVYSDAIVISDPSFKPVEPLTQDELEYYMNHTNKTSETPYYIWVDLARQQVHIFESTNDCWYLLYTFMCATGKSTTPTARGTFAIADRGMELTSTERVKYWVKFYKNYLFHSCPLTSYDTVLDARLGMPISNGCVRLEESCAKWLFEHIPSHTTVWVY